MDFDPIIRSEKQRYVCVQSILPARHANQARYIANSSTHWRATCNFPTDGVDYQDYICNSLSKVDLLAAPDEAFFADGMTLSRSGELTARTVQLLQYTVKRLNFILIVEPPNPSPVTSMAKME